MKERPILFSAPMVNAILSGNKTQTRRELKQATGLSLSVSQVDDEPDLAVLSWLYGDGPGHDVNEHWECVRSRYGKPGDRLWVRETYFGNHFQHPHEPVDERELHYRADGLPCFEGEEAFLRWRPSIHMPRWASRILLEVTAVRVERLHTITEADALAEGVGKLYDQLPTARERFEWLWRSINGADSWAANPYVWVIEFKRITA